MRVEDVGRLGKFILVRLAGPACGAAASGACGRTKAFLTVHLGMTGQVLVSTAATGAQTCTPEQAHAHTRFVFRLRANDGRRTCVEFRDPRKFGRIHLTLDGWPARLRALGPDAWQGEWDAAYLATRMRGRRAPLKAFLLDQRHLAGIGNIYADEILGLSGLSPLRAAGSLGAAEVECLVGEIRRLLGEGVRRLGCSLSDFVDTEGRPGTFQDHLQAYRRHGLPCPRCGRTMVREIVAGRGTAYCPGCQR
jgi:formamidopyrimidine-DNA glycosylase